MTLLNVVTPPDPILRQKTKPVVRFNAELQTLIDDMIETMRAVHGVGLAAPQVGRSLRLAVIETLPKIDEAGNEIQNSRELFVIINPEIVWTSSSIVDGIEGCLSIPGFVGEVTRYSSVRVKAQDRYGKKIKLRVNGWSARIFQHEIDHLDGILYIDRLTSPDNFWREEAYYDQFTKDDTGKTAPDAGKTALDAGKTALDAGKTALDAGKTAPDAGKTALDAGKTALDAGKTASVHSPV